MAQTIEDVESRTLLQQFHSLYKKQDAIETNVENVDAKVDQEKSERKAADQGLQKLIYQEATDMGLEISTLKNDMNTNTNKIEYNTTQISALQSGKQDKLTAGQNITIDENNVISASGGISSVKAENFDSESATSGQVLTANGSGGASWQNASGEKLYIHTIVFGTDPTGQENAVKNKYCKIYSKRQTVFSSMAELGQYLYEKKEIVLTTYANATVGSPAYAYYPYPLAIRGTNDSSDDYFEYLSGQRLDFEINDGSIKITSGAPGLWNGGSLINHNYFKDTVTEL